MPATLILRSAIALSDFAKDDDVEACSFQSDASRTVTLARQTYMGRHRHSPRETQTRRPAVGLQVHTLRGDLLLEIRFVMTRNNIAGESIYRSV